MFNFTFSGRFPTKTTKTSFLRSSLIPERMELGIFAEEWFSQGGVPKRSCSNEIENWSEVKFKKVFTKTTRFMAMICFCVSMNWRKGFKLGYVCLKPSQLGCHPKRVLKRQHYPIRFADLWFRAFRLCPRIPIRPKLFKIFKASEVLQTPVKIASVSKECLHHACECEYGVLTSRLR